MPRHLTVYCERVLCERVAPGARVTVLGIYSIKKIANIGVSIPLGCFKEECDFCDTYSYSELCYEYNSYKQ